MALDPNIILGGRAPDIQIQNPLDMAVKGAQLKSLSDLGKARDLELSRSQRESDEQQATRDAYKNNVVQQADGTTSLNRQGVLSDLYKVNPQLAMAQNSDFQKMDLDQASRQQKIGKDLLFGISDQSSYDAAKQKAHSLGLPGIDNMPQQYDPNLVRQWQVKSLTAEEQIAQANKDREFQLKSQENQYKHEENSVKRQELGQNKQNAALGQTVQLLESARGNPAAAQAEKDVYASQKINKLLQQYPNGDDMPPQMVKLLVSEVGKVAQGGSPTVDELQGLTPSTVTGKLAEASQKLMNQPTGANAGAFLKQYQQYAGGVAQDAKQLLKDKYGRVIESNRGRLNKDQIDTLQKQYVGRFDDADKAQSNGPKVGESQDGYTFKGGDPSSPSSWEKAK